MPRFYASKQNIDGETIVLPDDEGHHLRDVMRIAMGDTVNVFDGEGREYECSVDQLTKKRVQLSIVREIRPACPESGLEITIAAAILKGDKSEIIIQKAVELGVVRFIPLMTKRSEVRPDGLDKKMVRWRRISFDASKQCGRARLMEMADPVAFERFADIATVNGSVAMFSERDGKPFADLKGELPIVAVFGPEGGWDDAEIELARSKKFDLITLGGRILRAETAAIAITAILQHRFGDLN